jgi:hypothetical protein
MRSPVGPSVEPFGLAVLEAAQAGCPLVLSDLPGFRELWDGAALFRRPVEVPEGAQMRQGDALAGRPLGRAGGEDRRRDAAGCITAGARTGSRATPPRPPGR